MGLVEGPGYDVQWKVPPSPLWRKPDLSMCLLPAPYLLAKSVPSRTWDKSLIEPAIISVHCVIVLNFDLYSTSPRSSGSSVYNLGLTGGNKSKSQLRYLTLRKQIRYLVHVYWTRFTCTRWLTWSVSHSLTDIVCDVKWRGKLTLSAGYWVNLSVIISSINQTSTRIKRL